MARELVKIHYRYEYVDNKGNFEDVLYMAKNFFIDYSDDKQVKNILEVHLSETDSSKVFKDIIKVEMLGERLY